MTHDPVSRAAVLEILRTPQAWDTYADMERRVMALEGGDDAEIKRLIRERDDALTFLDNAVSDAPEPLQAIGKWLADMLDEDDWPTAERYLNAAVKSCAALASAPPAEQTEG